MLAELEKKLEKKEEWRLFLERAAQEVESAERIREELKEITGRIPGVKEAALEAIYDGKPAVELTLPDGKILIIQGSDKYRAQAGSSSEYDELGGYIPDSGGNVSYREVDTYVGIRDSFTGNSVGITTKTRVKQFVESGRISSQEGHVSAVDADGAEGFGIFSNKAPADRVLEKVGKVEDILRSYI